MEDVGQNADLYIVYCQSRLAKSSVSKSRAPLVEDFKESQARLIASYHGVHDVNDFNADQAHMMALYERAALPIEKGGMALNNVAFISLTAFACSLAASMRELAKVFPDWIEIVRSPPSHSHSRLYSRLLCLTLREY